MVCIDVRLAHSLASNLLCQQDLYAMLVAVFNPSQMKRTKIIPKAALKQRIVNRKGIA
jgi:hypothetical protein